jgi:hypothetical protein
MKSNAECRVQNDELKTNAFLFIHHSALCIHPCSCTSLLISFALVI